MEDNVKAASHDTSSKAIGSSRQKEKRVRRFGRCVGPAGTKRVRKNILWM